MNHGKRPSKVVNAVAIGCIGKSQDAGAAARAALEGQKVGTYLQIVDGRFVDDRWINGRWDLSQFAGKDGNTDWDKVCGAHSTWPRSHAVARMLTHVVLRAAAQRQESSTSNSAACTAGVCPSCTATYAPASIVLVLHIPACDAVCMLMFDRLSKLACALMEPHTNRSSMLRWLAARCWRTAPFPQSARTQCCLTQQRSPGGRGCAASTCQR